MGTKACLHHKCLYVFAFKNKQSIIKSLFLDEIDRSCLKRTRHRQFRYSNSYNIAKNRVHLPDQVFGFSNSWHPITSHPRDLLFEENCLYVSPQFHFEKQTDGATYRNTCLTDICICFHLASNNLSQDKCNIIDCALKIELQNGARIFSAIFCSTGHLNIKLKKTKQTQRQGVFATVYGCSKYTLNGLLWIKLLWFLWLFLYVICKKQLICISLFFFTCYLTQTCITVK